MSKLFHQIAMWLIFIGGFVLLYLAIVWFVRGNNHMGFGMLIMAIIAESNYFLHRQIMKKNDKK